MPDIKASEITIRDCRPEDFEQVMYLLQQLWPNRTLVIINLKESYLKAFELSGHILRCACYGKTLAGVCAMFIRNNLKTEGNLANIDELVVDGKMRGMNIGKLLLEDAENIARQHNCKSLGLESSFYRENAHRFYEQNGYDKQGYYITKGLE